MNINIYIKDQLYFLSRFKFKINNFISDFDKKRLLRIRRKSCYGKKYFGKNNLKLEKFKGLLYNYEKDFIDLKLTRE